MNGAARHFKLLKPDYVKKMTKEWTYMGPMRFIYNRASGEFINIDFEFNRGCVNGFEGVITQLLQDNIIEIIPNVAYNSNPVSTKV